MKNILVPVLDQKKIQEKANEAAMAGALKEVEDFYNSYSSPYRKAIKEDLNNKSLDRSFSIPDIVAVINDSLTREIDQIANTAVAKTFIPLVKEILTREESEVKFSKILSEFIENFYDKEDDDYECFSVEETRKKDGSFNTYTISDGDNNIYDINLFHHDGTIEIYTLPWRAENGRKKETMKISLDGGATLELPFTSDILKDKFMSFIARLIMCNSNIVMDVIDFDEDMFPRDHCYCD